MNEKEIYESKSCLVFTERIALVILVMQECVKGVLKKKTVILVTHQIDFLHEADSILVPAIIFSYGCL